VEKQFELVANELGIYDLQDKYPYAISGGQMQRTSAARAFIHQPKIIFADEPTGALDSKAASNLLGKLQTLNELSNSTIVMVTHDATAASYSSRVIFLKDGHVYSTLRRGESSQVECYKENMSNYTLYIFALVFSVALYFSFVLMSKDESAQKELSSGAMMSTGFLVGSVLLIFIIIAFVMFANAIFLKRRNRELALFQLIGL